MCQELYLDNHEMVQVDKSCWCPLADSQSLYHKAAMQEFGRLIWEKIASKSKVNPEAQEVEVKVVLRRW